MNSSAVATLKAMWNSAVALAQERRHQQDADDAVDEVANRQPVARRIVAPRAFHQRIDGAAEIGAEHQRERGVGRDELGIGQRHHQQHAGDAGMDQPGDERADQDAEHGIAGDPVQEHAHARGILGRRHRIEQDMQREQHQAEADRDPAEVLDPGAWPAAECDEADNEQHRRHRCDIERQHLHDQRGADIGAEHDRKRRHQADDLLGGEGTGDQGSRGRALEQGGQAEAGAERGEPVAERPRQQQPQIGPEGPQDPAMDHVQAPQQERDAPHQIKQNKTSHTSWISRQIRVEGFTL
jgi:hypothetical protein